MAMLVITRGYLFLLWSMTSASKNELWMHSPAAVRPEGPVDWALAPAPRSIEQGSPKAPAVARDQIHREEVKIQKTIEIQNPQFKKKHSWMFIAWKMPGRAIWECMAVLFDVAEDWGLWFHHDFFILYIHKIQSAISSDGKNCTLSRA